MDSSRAVSLSGRQLFFVPGKGFISEKLYLKKEKRI